MRALPSIVLRCVVLSLIACAGARTAAAADVAADSALVAAARQAFAFGRYAQAESLAHAAAARLTEAGVPDTVLCANALGIAANALRLGGHAADPRAGRDADRALALASAARPGRPLHATALLNRGLIAAAVNERPLARDCYERALAIWRTVGGADEPNIAGLSVNLALLDIDDGDPGAAWPRYEEALRIFRAKFPPSHYTIVQTLTNYGTSLQRAGDASRAVAMEGEALRLLESTPHPDSARLGEVLNNLGLLYDAQGEDSLAAALFARAAGIESRILGPEHPNTLAVMINVGRSASARGDTATALATLRRVLSVHDAGGAAFAEQAAADRVFLALALLRAGHAHDALGFADAALVTRRALFGDVHALVGQAAAVRAHALAAGGDSLAALAQCVQADSVLRETLRRAARGLSEVEAVRYLSTTGGTLDLGVRLALARHDAASAAQVWDAVVRSRAVVLEEMIARRRSGARDSLPAVAGLDAVLAALPDSAALIAFTTFGDDAQPLAGRRTHVRYAAFVATPGRPHRVSVVDIGDTREIDAQVARWQTAMREGVRAPFGGASLLAQYRHAARALRRHVWDPVARRADGARRVVLVPDGSIAALAFGTLPRESGGYLVESAFVLQYLSAERDLAARPALAAVARTPAVLAVGGVAYGAAAETSGARTVARDCDAAPQFAALPASAREVRDVARSCGGDALVLEGAAAREAAVVAAAPGRRVLHWATHAFFRDPACDRLAGDDLFGLGFAPVDRRPATDPLTRCGLALAGANRAARAASPADDGILTGADIAALDLRGVEWAVLSGCGTGQGVPLGGEGLFGLRRAFRAAGVRTLVLSLWDVRDEAARAFMASLYGARRAGRGDAPSAVRAAMLDLLAAERARGAAHPATWGAFIAEGN